METFSHNRIFAVLLCVVFITQVLAYSVVADGHQSGTAHMRMSVTQSAHDEGMSACHTDATDCGTTQQTTDLCCEQAEHCPVSHCMGISLLRSEVFSTPVGLKEPRLMGSNFMLPSSSRIPPFRPPIVNA